MGPAMSERDAFGPNLRRARVQRGIGLDTIAAATKISVDLFSALERNDFSRWPTGLYARAYVRAYAMEVGVDPEGTVDDFCRWFSQGDRRVERVVREQAALVGHDSQFKDDITAPSVKRDRRAPRPEAAPEVFPALAFARTGRIVAAGADLGAVALIAAGVASLAPLGWKGSLALAAVSYHALSLVALGCSPAVWVVDTYITNRHPAALRSSGPRFVRLLRHSGRT
jgi:hypothetical protein